MKDDPDEPAKVLVVLVFLAFWVGLVALNYFRQVIHG